MKHFKELHPLTRKVMKHFKELHPLTRWAIVLGILLIVFGLLIPTTISVFGITTDLKTAYQTMSLCLGAGMCMFAAATIVEIFR